MTSISLKLYFGSWLRGSTRVLDLHNVVLRLNIMSAKLSMCYIGSEEISLGLNSTTFNFRWKYFTQVTSMMILIQKFFKYLNFSKLFYFILKSISNLFMLIPWDLSKLSLNVLALNILGKHTTLIHFQSASSHPARINRIQMFVINNQWNKRSTKMCMTWIQCK